jgi:hypothetical protein
MASDCSGDFHNKVRKTQTAALGFQVKAGWAAVVLLTGTTRSAQPSEIDRIELFDQQYPESRQPYHAAIGELEKDLRKLNQRERRVRSISRQSLKRFLDRCQQKKFLIKRAAVVVGSKTDPETIANPHVRAHALEGRLFGSVVEQFCRSTAFPLKFSWNATRIPPRLLGWDRPASS